MAFWQAAGAVLLTRDSSRQFLGESFNTMISESNTCRALWSVCGVGGARPDWGGRGVHGDHGTCVATPADCRVCR